MTELSRAERNNNPGNLNFVRPEHAFNGQVAMETIPPGVNETARFGRYDTMLNGDRAAVETIIIDVRHHGLHTTDALISDETYGWAPGSDGNNDASYQARVVKAVNAAYGIPDDASDAFTKDTDLTPLIEDHRFMEVFSMAFYAVEVGHTPIAGLDDATHAAAVLSAMRAQGVAQ